MLSSVINTLKGWVTPAAKLERSAADQLAVQREADKLALYHSPLCGFCLITRRTIAKLNIDIELRNILEDKFALQELIDGGGRRTVPCLRIEHDDGSIEWMYESGDIMAYLERRFG